MGVRHTLHNYETRQCKRCGCLQIRNGNSDFKDAYSWAYMALTVIGGQGNNHHPALDKIDNFNSCKEFILLEVLES